MADLQNIILGRGLGDLLFGSSREKSELVLGEPDKIDRYSYDREGLDKTEAWFYQDLGLSLHFDGQENFKLGTLEVSSDQFLLNGERLINRSKDDVLSFVKNQKLGDYDSEDVSCVEFPDYELLTFDDVSLNLWFESGVLSEIQWSPFWSDDGQEVWPKQI